MSSFPCMQVFHVPRRRIWLTHLNGRKLCIWHVPTVLKVRWHAQLSNGLFGVLLCLVEQKPPPRCQLTEGDWNLWSSQYVKVTFDPNSSGHDSGVCREWHKRRGTVAESLSIFSRTNCERHRITLNQERAFEFTSHWIQYRKLARIMEVNILNDD